MKCYLLLAALAVAPLALAQNLKLSVFDRLKEKATDNVNITLPKGMLGLVKGVIDDGDADAAKIKKLLDGIDSILVRSLSFKNSGAYTKADVDQLRAELATSGWTQLVHVAENDGKDISSVWVKSGAAGEIAGLRVLNAEEYELSVVEIVGKVRLKDLAFLAGLDSLGIPADLLKDLGGFGQSDKKKKDDEDF